MTTVDPRICCAACDIDGGGELCRDLYCECHDDIVAVDPADDMRHGAYAE